MAYELGKAYINIVPKADGMGRSIEKELGGVGARAGSSKGSGLGGKLWGGLKKGAIGAGVAIGGVLAGSVAKGFQRLSAIEQAEAKLSGLGHSAESVEAIMANALGAVKGTAFGLDEAAGLAGTLVASGIKPGEELERVLALTADSATIAGRELGDMGLIWGSVAAKGKLQGDDAMQLLASGVPIWQMVGDVMGVTAAEAQELGSKGQVSFDIFAKAMEQGVGGAALEAGNTTQGAFKNMGAAMGRFGATLIKDVYPLIGPLFGKVTDLFDYLADRAGPAIEGVVGWFKEWAASDGVQSFLGGVRDVAVELYERALKPLGQFVADHWKPIAGALGGLAAFFVGGALVGAIGAVGGAIAAFVGGISWIAVAFAAAGGALTWFFTETEAGKRVLDALVGFVRDTLVPGIVGGFQLVRDFVVNELWPMIKSRFEAIRDLAVQVWQGVIQPAFEQFAGYIRDTVMPIIQRLWTEYVQPAFLAIGALAVWLWNNAIKPAMSAIDSFISNILGPAIVWLWQNVVSPTFSAIGKFIGWVWNTLIFPALDALKYFVTKVIPPAFQFLWETAKTVWNAIKTVIGAVVGWFQTWAWPVISLVIELIKLGFNALRSALKTAWDFIKNNVINPVVTWFRDTAWPILSRVIDSVKTGFNNMRDKIRDAWNFVRDNVIQPVATWFRDTIQPLFETATDKVGSAFDTMKDSVKKAWDAIQSTAKAPIKFVVETVLNTALIGNFNKVAEKVFGNKKKNLPNVSLPSGFARGGVLPGMSRMRDGDDQLVPMRRGEGVLVSEGLRTARDRAAFLAANAAGRRGIGFASLMQGGFAGGGVWDSVKGGASKAWSGTKKVAGKAKDLAGDALDKVLDGVDFVAEALKDPSSIFKKVYNAVIGKIPAAGLVTDMAKGAGKSILDGAIAKVKDMIAPSIEMPDLSSIKAGGSLRMAQLMAQSFGLTMTSHRRGGARTAGSGSVSLHASGRAMDFSNSTGPTSQMMAFFNAMHPFKPTELLYSPAGARQWRRSGRMADTSGATKRGHYNHVHVGFAEGGIFDQGGLMQPGMTGINLTRKPEAVLDPAQTRAYQAHAEAVSDDRPVSLSDEDRALLRAIAVAADLKVDGRSVVNTVRDSFKQARMPLVTA